MDFPLPDGPITDTERPAGHDEIGAREQPSFGYPVDDVAQTQDGLGGGWGHTGLPGSEGRKGKGGGDGEHV